MDNREAARQMRREGKSRSQIKDALGLRTGGSTLSRWLKDIPAPEWTKRPNAKDDLRALAVQMRLEGKSYRQILETLPLPIAKSSLSLWLRDIPLTDEQRRTLKLRQVQAVSRRAQSIRAQRVRRQEATMAAARSQVQRLAESELFVAGLTAYWAEGSKAKPWRPNSERVVFINSDASMIRLFLAWLDLIGVDRGRLIYRLSIHESADIACSTTFWARVVGVDESEFRRPSLKRHLPKTVRKNIGADYHGCLVINVRCSTELYRQIAGWWSGISTLVDDSAPLPLGTPSGVV